MKKILLTGASRGIGAAICRKLASSGAEIAACASRHPEELEAVLEGLGVGGRLYALTGDLSAPETPARLVSEAAELMGGIDSVISNAGISIPNHLKELDLDSWDKVFNVNVRAPWLLAASAHPWLKKSGGSFVAISSMSGIQPYTKMGAYSPSKAALIMLVRQLAQEWVEDGIRVNCVSPGLIRTPLSQAVYDIPEVKAAREELVPMHRIGDADVDIAGIVEFLISEKASYITGQNMLADGGLLDSIQSHIKGRPSS